MGGRARLRLAGPLAEGGAGPGRRGLPAWSARPARVEALARAVAEYEAQIDGYLDQDEELAGYVRRLELMGDDRRGRRRRPTTPSKDEGALDPEADAEQMVEDIERFLRDQGG